MSWLDKFFFAVNTIQIGGVAQTFEPAVNLIAGTNVTLTVADDPTNRRTTVTINSTGGGGSVTWANDLAGSTSTNQYVAAISGNGGLGTAVPVSASLTWGATPATAGDLRFANNRTLAKARNAGNTADIGVLGVDASNNLTLGDATNAATVFIGGSTAVQAQAPLFNINSATGTALWQFVAASATLSFVNNGFGYNVSQASGSFAGATAFAHAWTGQANTNVGANSSGGSISFTGGASSAGSVSAVGGGVTGATNATPIVITTSSAHNLPDGAIATIASVGGNTNANGTFAIHVLSATTFQLLGSTGNGAYTSGGTVTPVTVGGNAFLGGGTSAIAAANSGTSVLASGGVPTVVASQSGVFVVGQPMYFGGSLLPTLGAIRFGYAGSMASAVNYLTTHDNGSITMPIATSTGYNLTICDTSTPGTAWSNFTASATNCTLTCLESSGKVFLASQSHTIAIFNVPGPGTSLQWAFENYALPCTITQNANSTNSATAQNLTVQAQNATGTTSTGGDLILSPGTGTTSNGKLNLNNIITTTTVGAAGAASAMPTPVGYLNIKVNGSAFRVAYFN